MSAGIRLQGNAELSKVLQSLPARASGVILRSAVRSGAEVVRAEASRRAPRRTGNLSRHIGIQTVKSTKDHAVVDVGPDEKAWYGLEVEMGHAIVRNKQVVGHVLAKPYLRPAFDEKEREAELVIGRVIGDALEHLDHVITEAPSE